jgi:hypothetical protein
MSGRGAFFVTTSIARLSSSGGSSPLGKAQTRPLVVVATPPHGATHRAQYPKDHAKDHQDDTDCPKDGVAPKKGRDDQADDSDRDQVCLRCSGNSSAATLSVPRCPRFCPTPAARRLRGRPLVHETRHSARPCRRGLSTGPTHGPPRRLCCHENGCGSASQPRRDLPRA